MVDLSKLNAKFDYERLKKDDLFTKKRYRDCVARDTNKDGFISRADHDMIVQRHIEMGTPRDKIKELRKMVESVCDSLGLTDASVMLTYEEYDLKWVERIKKIGITTFPFEVLFHAVDLDNSGDISLEEWTKHNKALGIDAVHARASFVAMDANGDGKISEQEFIDYHLEYHFSAEDKLNSSILYGPLITSL